MDDEENEVGSRCVAAGVLDSDDRPVAALSVSAPTIRFDEARLAQVGQAVVRSSRELSAVFGPPPPLFAPDPLDLDGTGHA